MNDTPRWCLGDLVDLDDWDDDEEGGIGVIIGWCIVLAIAYVFAGWDTLKRVVARGRR